MKFWKTDLSYLDEILIKKLWIDSNNARNHLLKNEKLEGLKLFSSYSDPISLINSYIWDIWHQANNMGVVFDKPDFKDQNLKNVIKVSDKELNDDLEELCLNLMHRNYKFYEKLLFLKYVNSGNIFTLG